ncbi:MAG: peptidoglycan DD-metalloendopeptidase family protein [Lachnospiraceae bacterium]|nr:peptidoglycan DD-metalloendopeptidase family protein [Lachnospiraceae bacterium]
MASKRHKRKTGYTIMIVSDSVEKNQKKIHINTGILSIVAFVLLVVAICYAEYTTILMHGATERSETYVGEIARLQRENEELLSAKETLEKQVANLNQTLSQREEQVQMQEETIQAAVETENMPKGFPVSGAAQIKETGAEDDTGLQPEQARKEIIFIAAVQTNVTATGAGTVLEVKEAGEEPANVSIDHGNGYVSMYRNMGEPKVAVGSQVENGTAIFEIGEGNAEIGYSVSKDGNYLDPMEIIEIKG